MPSLASLHPDLQGCGQEAANGRERSWRLDGRESKLILKLTKYTESLRLHTRVCGGVQKCQSSRVIL